MRFADIWDDENLNAIDDVWGRLEITGVTCDSRRVEPGFVFAAFPGSQVDGRNFIADAVARGAAAVVVPDDDDVDYDVDVPIIRDHDARRRYAILAAGFAGRQPNHIAAVTGTNGKTSVAWFARQLLNASGIAAGSAGTLGMLATSAAGDTLHRVDGSLTTPDPSDLHRDLKAVAESGVEHLVLEASSHGLDQRRLDGVRVQACAFTNLSRDHLDYHGTEDAYLAAKLRLFDTLVMDGGVAVVNTDARYAEAFTSAAQRRGLGVLSVGSGCHADYKLLSQNAVASGLAIIVEINGEKRSTVVPLIGGFQAENALVALGLAVALGADLDQAFDGLSTLNPAPGRMEFCGTKGSANVYVDYAHTPDAIAIALQAINPHTNGKVHVIFGCGGDRDPGKRPEMARAAADNANVVYLTDDNPRSEDPAVIRKAALAGAPDAIEIGDRMSAIRQAITGLNDDDVLVVTGKGHEQGQTIGDQVLPFDDRDAVRQVLAELSS